MRLFYSGVSSSSHPRDAVPGVDIMWAYKRSFDGLEKFEADSFLDSGAFTLRKRATRGNWSFYRSREFREYLEAYAAFVTKFGVELYANIDVIGNAELTYRNQKLLEKLGIRPVPVVHFGTNVSWLQRYIDEGHKLIGLGGLVGRTTLSAEWLGRCFELACDSSTRLPTVGLHGFGIVNYPLLIRFPWWSVDSSAWVKEGGRWGAVFIPHKRRGDFSYSIRPHKVIMAETAASSKSVMDGQSRSSNPHWLALNKKEQAIVGEWLERIGVPVGGKDVEGVVNSDKSRGKANLLFFEWVRKCLPEWPWEFRQTRKGFDLEV